MAREYDLVVYGATGYTGKYCAEYLQSSAPTDLKWAIAGRNASKLQTIAAELKEQHRDRTQPAVEAIKHEYADLEGLARKTTVLIACVGPFSKYGTPVIEACAKNGTHYLDITGEVPWVHDMISRFHGLAKQQQTVLIPQCGIDSVPSDVMAYLLVKFVREKYNEGVVEVINSIQGLKNTASGGTVASVVAVLESYSASYLLKTMRPFALSPIPPSPEQNKAPGGGSSLLARLRGFISVPELGLLTDSPGNSMDRAIVHRSWGLFDSGNYYGKRFKFAALLRARNALWACITAYALFLGQMLLLLPPGRWLFKRFMPQPGEGAGREIASKYYMKFKGLAVTESNRRVVGTLNMQGSAYHWTGVFTAEAALELLRGSGCKAKREGGVLTPATLEQGYVDRLEKAGLDIQIKAVP